MVSVEFNYNQNNIIIQSKLDDKFKDIINKFGSKSLLDVNSLIFLYSGNSIDDEDITLSKLLGENKVEEIEKMKENGIVEKITILVYPIDDLDDNKQIIKSKYIICPKCKENIKYKINNYKIYLYECKNGHICNNLLLKEFDKTQFIDISKIKCNKCKTNKSETYKREFYKCLTCNINICPLCKSSHDKTHKIINYEQKDYICPTHNDFYVKYCYKCKKNLCLICDNEHKNHENILFGEILPNDDEKNYLNELKESIDTLKTNIKEITNKLNNVIHNLELYYKMFQNILNTYDQKERNYEILMNIKEIKNKKILEEINNENI